VFADSVLAFALVVLSTAAGIFGLYILPVAGVALLIVASISGLRVLLSYVRSPVGQHKDAGEGALTVAMLSTRKEARQLPNAPDEASSEQVPLFTVNVIGGYGTPTTGDRRAAGIPGPAEWIPPTAGEQTSEIPAVARTPWKPAVLLRSRVN
jgi:hypothetical protein